MNSKLVLFSVGLVILVFFSWVFADIPHQINYQGMLTETDGTPLDGAYNLIFKIYGSKSGTDSLWWEYQNGVTVSDGLFNVILGSLNPIPDSIFSGAIRYLGITVGTDTELSPRIELISVGYAYCAEWADTSEYSFQAQKADTADYAVAGGEGDKDWAFRITDTADTTIATGGKWGIARSGNVLYGNADSTHVNLGVACTTGTSGHDFKYCVVGGGSQNRAGRAHATVAGGHLNTADDGYATIGGGRSNDASHSYTTVAGGESNIAGGQYSIVGGGYVNRATGYLACVGGGRSNLASDTGAFVGGGYYNSASGMYATVGGGYHDTASAIAATVSGGHGNTASGDSAFIGGGASNTASFPCCAIAGGSHNTAYNAYSFVGGGYSNTAANSYATVAGGESNRASGTNSFVGGGESHNVDGKYACVPGGYADSVLGDYSFAAGREVRLTFSADHTFAFGRNFTTSTANAVIFHNSVNPIRVGIGVTAPTHYIDVAGGAYCDGSQWHDISSIKYKKDINPLTQEGYNEILNKLTQTQIVRYRYKSQDDDKLHIGVIAEEAPEEMVNSERTAIPTGDAIGFLLAAIKAQQEQIEALKVKIDELESRH